MSIQQRCNRGLYVNHETFINTHEICFQLMDHRCERYVAKEELFAIWYPFVMDSHFKKYYDSHYKKCGKPNGILRGKRKAEEKVDVPLEVSEFILWLVSCENEVFVNADAAPPNNNSAARQIAKQLLPRSDLRQLCNNMISQTNISSDDSSFIKIGLLTSSSKQWSKMTLEDEIYFIPPQCKFLLSDVSVIERLLEPNVLYDLVVMDPPWENKSVKRKKTYNWLNTCDIKELPIPNLAANNALIVVWVTNSQAIQDYVTQQVLPAWGAEYITTWYWLKITKLGQLVCDVTEHKKPYEAIILARYRGDACSDASSLIAEHEVDCDSGGASETAKVSPPREIPRRYVIASVPCSVHSRKVPLDEVLAPYVPPDARRLELFARHLTPGWTSWGNEVVKFQHQDYYREVNDTNVIE